MEAREILQTLIKEGSIRNPRPELIQEMVDTGIINADSLETPEEGPLFLAQQFLRGPYKDHELLELAKQHLPHLVDDCLQLIEVVRVALMWHQGIAPDFSLRHVCEDYVVKRRERK